MTAIVGRKLTNLILALSSGANVYLFALCTQKRFHTIQ
jgi:hypothetical protein